MVQVMNENEPGLSMKTYGYPISTLSKELNRMTKVKQILICRRGGCLNEINGLRRDP